MYSTYLDNRFLRFIDKSDVKVIFELGSRDLNDAELMYNYYDQPTIYAFECNPDCLKICKEKVKTLPDKIRLVEQAVSTQNGPIVFHPFDLDKYDNMGASSMFKIDFTKRSTSDADYCRGEVQKQILVEGIRLDTFCSLNGIAKIDMICMDLQEYELKALQTLSYDLLRGCKYIITECSFTPTYTGGCSFNEINDFLSVYGFEYKCSDVTGTQFPMCYHFGHGYSGFNCVFTK